VVVVPLPVCSLRCWKPESLGRRNFSPWGKGNLALGKRKPRLGQVTLVDIYIGIKLVDGPLAVAEDEGTDRLAGVQEVEAGLDVDGKAGTVGNGNHAQADGRREETESRMRLSQSRLVRLAPTQDFLINLSMLDWTCRVPD
jgi:hypothetical protein